MKTKKVSIILLTMILASLILGVQFETVQAYVQTPVITGQLYDIKDDLCGNYGYQTAYDRTSGTTNNPYYFPGFEVHTAWPYDIWEMSITVSGTKPDGSPISGLEFLDLAYLASPNNDGTEWYYVLTVIYNLIKDIAPTGASALLVFGQSGGASTGYSSTSAWVNWHTPSFPVIIRTDKGLQFRFALHCDPDLYGYYRLTLKYHIEIHYGTELPYPVCMADFYQYITYYYYDSTVCCVAEGTLVTMADGSTKPIEKIKKGDQVLGFWPTNGSYMVEKVLDVTKSKFEVMVNINNGMLKITPLDHPIFIRNSTYEGWMRDPADIQVGWEIYNATSHGWVPVTSVTFEEGKTRGYDLVLDGYETYIANGILVLDKNGC